MLFILLFQYFSQDFFKIILRLVYYNKINGKMRRKKGNLKTKYFYKFYSIKLSRKEVTFSGYQYV